MVLPNKYLNDIQKYIPGKSIEEVKKEFNLKEVIKLASNENPFGFSKNVINAINKFSKNLNRYPDGYAKDLKEKLSKKLNIGISNLIIGNGSDEIIDLVIKAYLSKNDEVLTCFPTFSYYKISAKSFGVKFKEIPLKNYKFNVEGLLNSINPRTKLIIICNPNNPTGTFLNYDELTYLIENTKNILILIDEAYFEFYDEDKKVDGVELIKRFKNKDIIILRTFSKIYGLAGLRIGYGISKREIIENLHKVKPPFNVNYLAQISAIEALEDESFITKVYKNNLICKKKLYDFFNSLKIFYLPSQANFVFFDPKIDNEIVFYELLKEGVIIRSLKSFGFETALRVSIGLESEINIFVEKFKKVFYKLNKNF